jgi:glutamate decarboxylase
MGNHPSANQSTEANGPDLIADWEHLFKVFIRPEDNASRATLIKYMEQILFGLHDFLRKHVGITEAKSLKDLSERFTDTIIRENPEKKLADVITCVIDDIAPHAVNVASPYFVGHMTSAIPFFMVHLKTIVAALNQNVVKLETSKVVSIIEKQVIAKIHRMIFENSEAFYQEHVQNTETTLGAFVEGGTSANLTALWVARNARLSPKSEFDGIEMDGIAAAYKAHGIDRAVILVSRLGHYSLRKAAGILGIGNKNVIPIDTDERNKIDLQSLRQTIQALEADQKTGIIAVVGIAGATETGTIDPLPEMADICAEHDIHLHVDAAWGGPTLFSRKYKHLLDGIKRADSVTIDGHKQFYMPMSCGMVYFKSPTAMDVIAYYANYVNRRGSVDLGIKSLSGSREANSLILDSALKIMGTKGYELLINHGIETAAAFAEEIERRENFELVTAPELNILTYRLCPPALHNQLTSADSEARQAANERLNAINRNLQRLQREAGWSFVSRTALKMDPADASGSQVVLRAVIMNPMTTLGILTEILDEQEEIYHTYLAGDF